MVSGLRRGSRLAPRVLAADSTGVHACLVPTQAGPLAGDHDRVTIRVGAGATLIVEPIGAACALAGSARTLLELDVELGAGARLVFEEAPLILACGANVARSTTVRLAAGAVAALRDVIVLGGEGHAGAGVRLISSLRVADPRGALLHDALRVDPTLVHGDGHVALAPGHRVVGTLSLFGLRPPDDDPEALALAREGMLRRATAPGLTAVNAELARTWARWSHAVTTALG